MTIELNEESTHEDIEAAVEALVEQDVAERDPEKKPKPEDKSDAERHRDFDEDTGTEEVTGSQDTVEEDKEADWLTNDLRDEAAALGIDEKELAEFTSREELERSFRILNRAMDADRKAVTKERSKESEKPEKPTEDSEAEASSDGKSVLSRDVYEDELVDAFEAQGKQIAHLTEQLTALQQRLADADAVAEEERFDRSVDSLQFATLFGKTGEESETEMKRRSDLLEHVRIEQEVYAKRGINVDYDTLVERVARMHFPDEFEKKTIKNHTRRISRQSDKRQGGGATRPTDPTEDPREVAARLYRELEGAGV